MHVKVNSRLGFIALIAIFFTGCIAEGDLPSFENQVPFANAGQDQSAGIGDRVEVSGSGSVDLDGDVLSYVWLLNKPSGSTAQLDDTNVMNTAFIVDVAGEYTLSLVVNDGQVSSSADAMLVSVTDSGNNGQNRPPIADAGLDLNVQTGLAVTLDGTSSSDPDGDTLTFDWQMTDKPLGSAATLEDSSTPRSRFAPDLDGEYEITLVVSDGTVEGTPATVFVRAFSDNTPPLANAGADQVVATGSRVDLDGTTSVDADGDTLSFTWTMVQTPAGSSAALSATDVANPSFTADKDGEYVVELTVNDGSVESVVNSVTITATDANVPPVAHAGLDQNVAVGVEVTLDGSLSADANDDPLTFAWSLSTKPAGSSASLSGASTQTPKFTADVEGSYIAQLIVRDGVLDSPANTVTITATLNNVAPIADAGADVTTTTGSAVQLDGGQSSDGDNDTLTYAWSITAAPTGSNSSLTSSTSATPSITPDRDGTYVIQLIVNDGNVDSSANSMVITSSTPSNPSPSVEGDIIITELMVNPFTVGDTSGEWFEIYNPSTTQTWDLQGCTLEDLGIDHHTISGSLEIGPGEYMTFARNANIGFTPDYVYSGFPLGNTEDEVLILCDNGTNEVANVAWGTALGPNFVIPDGASLELMTSHYNESANDDGLNWCPSLVDYNGDTGSPGAAGAALSACPP